jgi:predicted transcriptional regulator of viral defense system
MPRPTPSGSAPPEWDRLYDVAAAQAGYLTLRQASEAGYSRQLIQHYVHDRRLERVARGVLRLVHFPSAEHEDLVPIWLWSEQQGVFSHETALLLHNLSDALPARRHVTLPSAWKARRIRRPRGVVLYFADVPKKSVAWVGAVPVTAPLRTIFDCVSDAVAADLVRQAVQQGVRRGLFERAEVQAVMREARSKARVAPSNLRKP